MPILFRSLCAVGVSLTVAQGAAATQSSKFEPRRDFEVTAGCLGAFLEMAKLTRPSVPGHVVVSNFSSYDLRAQRDVERIRPYVRAEVAEFGSKVFYHESTGTHWRAHKLLLSTPSQPLKRLLLAPILKEATGCERRLDLWTSLP